MFGKNTMSRPLAMRFVSAINNSDPNCYKELVTLDDIMKLKPIYRSPTDKTYEIYAIHSCDTTILVQNHRGEVKVDFKHW